MHTFFLNSPNVRLPELNAFLNGRKTMLALGNFDGVHLAHRMILEGAVALAEKNQCVSAVFTFLQPKRPFITTLEERLRLFEQNGIELALVADFDAFCRLSPGQFLKDTLQTSLFAAGMSCGFNFRFGYRAAGDPALLQRFCRAEGLFCQVAEPALQAGVQISSTEIRRRVSVGDLDGAAQMLGRPYALSGKVLHGRAVGRKMDCPTLNLPIDEGRLLPPYGVYFTRCHLGTHCYPAVTNIGIRPTFGLTEVGCESHLLSAGGDFYDLPLTVELLHFQRPEQKWEDQAALADAIHADVSAARKFFGI